MPSKQEFHISIISNDKSAVDCLAEESGLSKQKLKQYMQMGCVWLEREIDDGLVNNAKHKKIKNSYIQRLRRAKKILNKNDTLHFYYDESVLVAEPQTAILIKDLGDYSIWNKPSGMLSQGSKWGDHCTIYRWAEKQLHPERPAFIVHRLDRAANGLIILAHKKSVASQFSKMFENREIEKHYQVRVTGDFSKMLDPKEITLTVNDDIDHKIATSYITFLDFDKVENASTLEVRIETGRKHQIRKHLSSIGFAVIGDRLHGSNGLEDVARSVDLQLQAKFLSFICPITAEQKTFKLDS